MTTHYHFVVAVDFGTTYSSVTCHQRPFGDKLKDVADKQPKLFSIKNYPGASASKMGEIFETPTEILYSEGQTFYGYDAWKKWDSNMHRQGILLQWFKLVLDDSKDEQRLHEAQRVSSQLDSLGLTIGDAITDYLTFLLGHTKSELQLNNRYCDDCTVQLVLTVPNVWNARACSVMAHAMETAAKDLSFGHDSEVYLVSEADAAATYFCDRASDVMLNLGDVFMTADLGGGTSDLMVYKVTHVYPFRFDPVVPGDGAVCGSSHLNKALVSALKTTIEADPRYRNTRDYLPEGWTIDDILSAANHDFDTVKKDVRSDSTGDYITVPFLPKLEDNPDSASNSFYANREFIDGIYLPLFNQILGLIQGQMQAAAKNKTPCTHVVLIGGFSLSNWLLSFLRENINDKDCRVMREHTSQDAISRGGCLRYFNQVSGPDEIMQASYGFVTQEVCEPDKFEGHKPENAVQEFDADDGGLYACDCVTYIVHRGQRIPAQGQTFPEKAFVLDRTFRHLKQDLLIRIEFVENKSDNVLEDHFHYGHDKNIGCRSQGEIEFVIPARELKQLAVERVRGEKRFWNKRDKNFYYLLRYEARIKILGKNIRYELWIGGSCKAFGVLTGLSSAVGMSEVEARLASLAI
ncbi:hypothetical protein AYO20_09922 [Fonsecaea nubica]|uniref:Actin-like ATPase domain-containing protein n=1 Tax=Fonsecaea nubica TaxID=856822 RepID=A0A178CA89_9EURO|nr:hypothetical protein AYO20_09922 [Fonsecaea nubica]OAL26889.1 hypothetical protein AYO20_09922 [Fonsecaea nubica]